MLVFPVLALIVFGIIDFGNAYNNYQQVRTGARDGVRQAIITATPTITPANACVGHIHMTSPPAQGTAAYDMICYTKKDVGLNLDDARVRIVYMTSTVPPYFATGKPLMFCVQYPIKSTSGLLSPFLNGRVANTQSETLIEQDSSDGSLVTGTITEDPVTKWPSSCLAGKL